MKGIIKHEGTIRAVSGNKVVVGIIQTSACSSCEAKAMCQSSENKLKEVDVWVNNPSDYSVGQQVTVQGSVSMGFRAVVLAYCVPLVVLLVVLFAAHFITHDDPLSGILALASVLVYYIGLSFFKNALTKNFSFTLI